MIRRTAALSAARRTIERIATSLLLPAGLLAVIATADVALHRLVLGVVPFGLLDWSAHLSTATLVLLSAAGTPWLAARPRFAGAALAGSVLIDLDHLALYAGLPVEVGGGRPFTHALITPVVIGLAWLLTGRRSPVLAGLGLGVVLHFVRDIATGPGLTIWWPVSDRAVLLPYWVYATAMVACAVVATVRAVRR